MRKLNHKFIRTDALFTTALIRWMVGLVFLSEGIEMLFIMIRGAGAFSLDHRSSRL